MKCQHHVCKYVFTNRQLKLHLTAAHWKSIQKLHIGNSLIYFYEKGRYLTLAIKTATPIIYELPFKWKTYYF